MKLFKWIAADPEKLDNEKGYSVLYYDNPRSIFYNKRRRGWKLDTGHLIEEELWTHIQVAVDAEVSEGFPEALIRAAVRIARGSNPNGIGDYTEDEIVNELKKKV